MSKEPQFKLLSKEEIEKNRIKAYKYVDMSKEQTPIEELIDLIHDLKSCVDGNGVPNIMYMKRVLAEVDTEQLLTKEKEQREELIKKAFTDGAEWELYGDDKTQEERAQQYYNEVIKPKQR